MGPAGLVTPRPAEPTFVGVSSMPTLPPPPGRPKPARACRLLVPPSAGCPGILDIDMGREAFSYFLRPVASDFGTAYRLDRFDTGDTYHVNVGDTAAADLCDCTGFERWGHCKHAASCRELLT